MEYESKTKAELIKKLKNLCQRISELEKVEVEYKEVKQELTRTHHFYKNILNSIDDPVFVKDEQHRWVFLNDALCRFWDLGREELIGKSDYDIFPKEEANVYWAKDNKVFETGKTDLNEESQTIGGERHIISTKKSLYKDTHTEQRYIAGTIRDITERKKAEEKLRESEEMFRCLSESSPMGIWYTDNDGRVLYTNNRWQEITGLTLEESLGFGWSNALHPDDKKTILEEWDRCLREEKDYSGEFRFISTSGDVKWVYTKTAPIRSETGQVIGHVGSNEDITERKKAEIKLKESEIRYRALFEASADGILIADIETKEFTYANPALCKMLGYSEEELKKMRVENIHPKESLEYVISEFEAQGKGEKTFAQYIPCLRKDGAIIYMDINTTSALIDGRKCNIGFFRDITKQKQLEEQLQIRQRMDSLGTLAGGVAHDFNNLLTGIMGYLDILLNINNEGLSEHQKEYIENALISCHRAADLVKQFQTLSKGSISEKSNIDLYEASIEVLNMLDKTTDKLIEKKIDFKPGEFCINADPSELNQVLLNLGTNAVKAIEERGVKPGDNIRIRAKEHSITGKDRTGLTEGEYVHIFFEDNGIGMSDEVRKQAFDPLFTTGDNATQKGQGLGLAMVYNIVIRNHNGSIDIETIEGKGTTFHIYLPKALSLEEAESKEVIRVVGGNETVLIVEDEEMVQNLAKEVLKNYGYKVLTALNGKQGLDIFNTNKEPIDLVLLDLTMPEMSGPMVLEEILKISPDVKVIISSGHSEEDTRKGILYKAKAFVSKPYKTKDLAQTVRTVLDL